ncbi:MAG: hypothetical protein WCO04_10865, partial [Pseudomonadota bacterium]
MSAGMCAILTKEQWSMFPILLLKGLLDIALYFFAYFFLTIGPLLAAMAGWNILFGKELDDGYPKLFVQLVL